MTVGIDWLLAQPELDLRLVVGDASGDVSWAHASDLEDPTPWLKGGELLMTTGSQLPRSTQGRRSYVDRLTKAGIGGLGFGVGIAHERIPSQVVDACAEQGLALFEVPLPTPFIAIAQAVARRVAELDTETLQRALAYQRRITRTAVRSGLQGQVAVLSRELPCQALVLDEYGAVMASSTKDTGLVDLVTGHWRGLASPRRGGVAATETAHGTLEFQTLRGRSAVVGWLAVIHQRVQSPTDRLLLNETAGLITLQLDWPAELIAAYHDLGSALLDLLCDPRQDAAVLVPHLRHFGFGPADLVVVALADAPRSAARVHDVINQRLEATARPHVVTRVERGVLMLILARDAAMLVDVLDRSIRDARITGVVIGISTDLPQTSICTGASPAQQAAAAARRDGRGIGWFDEMTLAMVVSEEELRSRIGLSPRRRSMRWSATPGPARPTCCPPWRRSSPATGPGRRPRVPLVCTGTPCGLVCHASRSSPAGPWRARRTAPCSCSA